MKSRSKAFLRTGLCLLSVALLLISLAPYRWAAGRRVSSADELIIAYQGCTCPDARVVSGRAVVPPGMAPPGARISAREVNLQIDNSLTLFNPEVGFSKLLLQGRVVALDTWDCTDGDCELIPRFRATRWSVISYVPSFWTFPVWLGILSLINTVILLPALLLAELVIRLRRSATA